MDSELITGADVHPLSLCSRALHDIIASEPERTIQRLITQWVHSILVPQYWPILALAS